MVDADDVRRIAVALPEVEEVDSDGFDFRVGGRGFVWSYPERRPGQRRVIRTDVAVLFVGDEAEKQALLLGEPELFFTAEEYDGAPYVLLRLTAVAVDRLSELVTDAWRMRSGRAPGPADAPAAEPAAPRRAPTRRAATLSTSSPPAAVLLELDFRGALTHWRGPPPYHFVAVPERQCARVAAAASSVTYGWGMIPVTGRIGASTFTTSLWPKDGGYLLPVKDAVRRAEDLQLGDLLQVHLEISSRPQRTTQRSR